ncbi:Chromosome partition protein Smc [Streptococcus infantarius subsp. infantarius]|nr:Chromosome partition protein Smc [Streptococcus infantarius subsp. infantarius]
MITFLDERDVEHGALATIKVTNAVNGERSLTGEIESGDYVLANIERGWRLRFDDEFYVVTYAKPIDDGKGTHVTFDAVHQFFWDFDKSSVHEQLNDGSHTFLTYLDFIFTGSDYTYTIDPLLKVYAFEKQSFGYKSRLNLFNDIITASGVEFQVNGKVVRILEKTGTDLSTVVRKNFNMNELGIEKHIGDFVTYQKGFGAWVDENDHTKGRLVTEYTSPLASVYGKLEAEPLVDERYTQADNMIAVLKANVDNSYSISVRLDMEDLTRAGYEYTQPRAGDYIMAINETLDFQEKIRIVSFTSEYDVTGQLIKHEVTCNDIGAVKKLSASYNLTKEQAQNASDSVGKAVEMANKALVSADGKSTVYFGNEFPKDEPKGTLHKGDSLYLTVGDTTKMYYWTGADWEELPIVNDVEAFKEQIADELKDVPNREEFENKIAEELANSKAEIETQIETAKTQAESNAKEYADTINEETAKVAELANAAADEIKADLVNVKNNLTATSLVANNAQAAVDEAKQDLTEVASELNTAKQDLANSVTEVNTKVDSAKAELTQAKQDLQAQASQLTAQANAQSELTNRVSSVEETANGTKTTVSELSKTVAQNGKDITSVTARTKVVEDDLTSTKTTLSQVQTTADGANQKTATLETGLNGLNAKFETLKIGSRNYFKNSKSRKYYIDSTETQDVRTFIDDEFWQNDTRFTKNYVRMSFDIAFNPALPSNFTTNVHFSASPWYNCDGITFTGGTTALQHFDLKFDLSGASKSYKTDNVFIRLNNTLPLNTAVSLENFNLYLSAVVEDYSQNEADIESKVAEYKQTAEQNYASLQSNLQTLDGTVKQNKSEFDQTAQGFSTRIESLETYKDGETTRANQYFESAKTETARQLTAERTAIAKDYVAKSTYTSDVTGIRNDLTATTTTANTTKTNLANYQASNDKAVANLQSNLQTANGNISSLQTKVEAVPGQITSAVSSVEGKIPTEIGSSNLLRNTAVNAENLKLFGKTDTTVSVVEKDGHQVYKLVVSGSSNAGAFFTSNIDYYNLIKDRNYTFSFWVLTNKDKNYNMYSLGHIQAVNTNGDNVGNDILHQHTQPVYSTNVIKANTWTKIWCTFKATSNSFFRPYFWYLTAGDEIYIYDMMLNEGKIPLSYTPAVEDTVSQISTLNTTLTQTAEGLTQLSTKVDTQGSTITSHTNSINSLSTGLSAKVSQTDFNTLSSRVTTAENNITAKANELSSKITSVEGKIPTSIGGTNLVRGTANFSSGWTWNTKVATVTDIIDDFNVYHSTSTGTNTASNNYDILFDNALTVLPGTEYTLSFWAKGSGTIYSHFFPSCVAHGVNSDGKTTTAADGSITHTLKSDWERYWVTWKTLPTVSGLKSLIPCRQPAFFKSEVWLYGVKLERGSVPTDWSPAPEDYDSKLAAAQSEIKQTTDSIKASVSSLDKSTVKSASLTINTDGVVIKAGKSTSDFANAVGSYFSVNQNAINLFSDKINVKGNMIVDGAITSTKIASKTIDTAHLNGKIITADVISSNAVTADAIKAGAVTTDKMSANSINGDRITAGTLDAAKIKAGSITASQIASGTITSAQIKTGTISAGNIATGAITTDKIAANSINSDKIVSSGITANVINGGKLQSLTNTTNFDLDTGKLFYNNNNTGVFRVEDGASTMGLKFSNTAITVNNTSRILSRVILGGDRRETTLDDGKWDQGGFTGIVAETINGVDSNQHAQADTLRVIGDNIYFTHSYNYDSLTSTSAQGWKMETFSPFSSYAGNVVLKPYGINYRQSDIITGDIRLDNGDGSGYWVRGCIRTLRNCFQHYLNGGTTSGAMNAIRDALKEISGV